MSKLWRVLLLAVFVMSMTMTGLAGAASVTPTLVDPWDSGNAEFEFGVICDGEILWAYKVDDWDQTNGMDGIYTHPVYDVTITISNSNGYSFDWSATKPVAAVIVKAGTAANIYYYDPAATSDTNLVAPYGKEISHVTFGNCDDGNGGEKYSLSGSKWYDFNADGIKGDDEVEPYLEGWKISLYKSDGQGGWVWVEDDYTNDEGGYSFPDLEPGMYKVVEGVDAAEDSCWVQTFPESVFYEVEIEDENVADKDFGNVCINGSVGYTMGFWSNQNGAKALAESGLYSAEEILAIQATFRAAANAKDMCVMLTAQALAHELNITVPVKGETANYSGSAVIIDGVAYDYDEVIADFEAFVLAGDCDREQAEWYKDFFDGLNNNWFWVVEYYGNACDVPTMWQ